jgi:hypothetical protein
MVGIVIIFGLMVPTTMPFTQASIKKTQAFFRRTRLSSARRIILPFGKMIGALGHAWLSGDSCSGVPYRF